MASTADIFTKRVSKKHLLEGNSRVLRRLEPHGAGTEATNRASRDLEHVDALGVHATLGVYRTVSQTEGPGRRGHLVYDGLLDDLRRARGRNVDGFLEERANERIRLVEDDEGP